MPSTIITKNSSTASSVPSAGSLTQGELAVNVTDKRLYTKDSGGTVVELGTNPSQFPNNIGVGVTPSAWVSSWKALEQSGISLASSSTIGIVGQNWWINSSGTDIYRTTAAASIYKQTAGAHSWGIAPSGTAGNAITFTQAMTLTAAGNLGLGTTSPVAISNYVVQTINGTNGSFTEYQQSGSNSFRVGSDSSAGGFISTPAANPIRIITNDVERARIDSSGNLLVGVTGSIANGSNTASGIQIAKTFMWVANEDASYFQRLGSDGTVQRFYRGANFIGSISVTTTGTVYNTTSDYRLKNVTGTLTGYKERLMSLQPKQGTWKSNGSEFRGFLAHEFAQPYSSSVIGEKDALDESGDPIYQGMQASSSEVMADLVALVQEQQAIIESLKARLDAANL